jgi:hypothetical protein
MRERSPPGDQAGWVIHEVDEGLRALLKRDVARGSDIEVVFDAPNTDWASRRGNTPTINVYLYDIREDTRRRTVGSIDSRTGGLVESRQRTPRFFRLSYIVTAWTQRPEDEHRLLAAVLTSFLRYDVLPRDVLGALADGPPVGMSMAMPPSEDRSLSDVWSALGGELKPSLDLVLTAAVAFEPTTDIAPPVLDVPTIVVRGSDYEEAAWERDAAGGRGRGRRGGKEGKAGAGRSGGGGDAGSAGVGSGDVGPDGAGGGGGRRGGRSETVRSRAVGARGFGPGGGPPVGGPNVDGGDVDDGGEPGAAEPAASTIRRGGRVVTIRDLSVDEG